MKTAFVSIGLLATAALNCAPSIAQTSGSVIRFQLPRSTGPFIPNGPKPMDKHRVDCGDGTYAEGKPVTVNGKKGMMYNCSK